MDPRTRIGDMERERAQSELARHYTDGRLDHDEYIERLDALWTAKTTADIRVLFSDLPRPVAPPPARPLAVRRRRQVPWLPVIAILIGLTLLFELPLWLLVFPLMFWAHRCGR